MAFADDLINSKKKKKKGESFADEVISGGYDALWATEYNKKEDISPLAKVVKEDIAPVKEEKSWLQSILQKPEAFKDGYQFGDVTKTILGTTADIGVGAVKGVAQTGEGIGKLFAGGVAQIADWTGNDEYANKVRKKLATKAPPTSTWLSEQQEKIDDYSTIGDTGDKVSEAIGYIGSIWASGAVGGAGAGAAGASTKAVGTVGNAAQTATMFSSASGNALSEAYKKENVTDAQAWTKALGSGAIETYLEKKLGIFGKNGIANAVSGKITSGIGKILTRTGIQATEEAIEEFLSYAGNQGLDLAIDRVSNGEGAEFKENWNWEEVGEQMAVAFLASGVLGGGANASQIINNKTDTNTWGEAINETATQQDAQAQIDGLQQEIAAKEQELNQAQDAREQQIIQEEIDNLNQELTEATNAQQITDEDTYYHGTRGDFDTFDNSKIGQNYEGDWSSLGKGFYFTNNYDSAKEFGESSTNEGEVTVKEAKLDIKKPFYVDDITKNDKQTIDNIKEKYELGEITNGYNLIDELKKKGLDSTEVLKESGFDGIIAEDEVMVFDASQINTNKQATQEFDTPVQDIKTNQQDITINDEVNDIHSGETFSTMSAKVDGKTVATLEYGEYEGKPNVKMIEVQPEYRRQGIATKLLQELQKKYPEQEIDFGMTTEDGTKLLKNITYQVENKEYAKKQKELEEINNKIQEYENSEPKKLTEEEIDEWNKLYDRQSILDKELFKLELDGQSTKKTFIKTDKQTTTPQQTEQVSEQISEQVQTDTPDIKTKQLEIIQKTNPMQDDYHVGIRSVEDIKTFDETINDDESFVWGDFSQEDAKKALEKGTVTVYSSKPIENGNFVSTSKNMARDYAGNGKIYSQEVNLSDVAWINGDEGQYAKVDTQTEVEQEAPTQEIVSQVEEVIAPLQETIENLTEQVKTIQENFAPTSQDIVEQQGQEAGKTLTDEDMLPIAEDTTPEVETGETTGNKVESPFDERDIKEVGKRSVKAYQYENPEVRPYFQIEANNMLGDLDNTIKGERTYNDQLYYDSNGEKGWFGTTRQTTEAIAYLKDNYGYSYEQIRKGLNDIIEDNGKENNAVAKRIEFMLDERLREGYTTSDGIPIPPNEEYINFLKDKQITEYNKEVFNALTDKDAPIEIAPDVQESPTINQNTQEQQLIPMAETTAQNQNTELSDTSTETQEQEKVAEILSERPTQENKKQRLWAKFRAGVFDKGSVFEDLSIKNKNRELMSKWDYMLTAEARAQSAMINGHKQFDSETKTETQTSKSLNDIQTEVGDKVQEFSEYLYHKHNISRMSLESNAQARMTELQETALAEYDTEAIEKLSRKRITEKTDEETAALIETAKEYVRLSEVKNKPVFGNSVTADISKEIANEYEMNNPEFMDWAKDVYDYNKANLDQLVQSGVISQETADQFAEIYPDYVPIGRANKNGNAVNVPLDTNRTGINAPIARAKGGNGDILPLFDTMAKRTIQTYRAVAKNNFGVELKNTLKGNTINETTNVDEVLDNVDQQESLLQEGKDGKAPTFTVFENGEKVTYEITQDMYEALKPVSDSSLLSTTFKPFNKISNFHRGVLTEYNPVFMLTNSIKDFQDVLLNSQHAAKTYPKFGESYAQIIKKGYWYQEYMANGGEQNSYFDSQEGTFNAERKGMAKVLDTFPLKQISQLNNVIEMAPRLAEYIASRESGRSIETSMLDAARVTTNFKAGGDLTKWANRNGATFLNASIQGAMQQVRNVREANMNGLKGYANLATKFALAGVPAMILNSLLWGDDEEYEELSDYVKQSYWIVGKYGDGNFIRIPKGRMVTVIQESFNQMKNLITGNDEADLGQFLEVMATNIAPNNPIENNVLSPIIGAVTNKAWYGDDLVPTRLQDVPAEEQYDESIDKLSIAIGQATGISPYKINYVLDQYSGGVGDVLLPMMTPQAETSSDNVGSKLLAPLTSKFSVDGTMKNQNTSDLYDLSDKLATKANSSKATDEDVLKNKYINSIKSEMNELYKAKRELQNSDIPDSEKYDQVREIQKQINSMAEEAVDNYKDVTIKSSYSTVGGKEYYKNNKGEWEKVKDKEAAELSSMNMSVSDKNTYFKTKNEINKIAGIVEDAKDDITIEDEDSEEYKEAINSLSNDKKAKIIDTIKNTNLPDDQKAYLYGKHYASDKTLEKVISSGIAFDDYLTYSKDSLSLETSEDKAEYLYNADMSEKTKTVIYETSVLTGFDDEKKYKDYKTIKAVGVDINSWLSYTKQEFKADKNSSGKSISGSRKDKVFNYINSLNLSIPQKAIMLRTEYPSVDEYNKQIVNYVSNLGLSYEEKVEIFENIDMTVKDNRVYWD